MKFSIKDFFSKCDQIRRKLRIWSHLLKKTLMENFIFCAVSGFGNKSVHLIVALLEILHNGEDMVIVAFTRHKIYIKKTTEIHGIP